MQVQRANVAYGALWANSNELGLRTQPIILRLNIGIRTQALSPSQSSSLIYTQYNYARHINKKYNTIRSSESNKKANSINYKWDFARGSVLALFSSHGLRSA